MRMWKLLGLGLLVATFCTATGFAFPHGEMGGAGAGPGGPGMWRLLRALNLTDDQKTQIHDLFVANRPTVQALRSQMRTTRQQLVDQLMISPSSDTSGFTQQLASLHGQLLQNHVALAQQILNILTPDQLAQAGQIKDQLRSLRATEHQLLSPPQP